MWATSFPFLAFFAFFIVVGVLLARRSRRRLRRWAITQGYDLLRIEYPPLFRPGPFFLQHARGWGVRRIVVRTSNGGERLGWVCYPAGLPFFDSPELTRMQLVWDDEWDRNRLPLG